MTRRETADFLRAHDNYVILTHRRPDGDTVGCAIALCRGLRALGKTAWILKNRQFTARFAPYLEGLVCEQAEETATVVSVDIAADNLLAFGMEQLLPRIALAIDHHGKSRLSVANILVEPERAACGEIVFGVLRELGVELDKDMAEALYIAVSTDTGCFKFANTGADTLRIAAALYDAGADTAPINKLFFDTKSLSRLQLESRLTANMEFYAGGLVGICVVPKCWLQELGIDEDEMDSISGFARSVEGVEIGVTIREVENGKGKASLRTGPRFNAGDICARLGGGGHAGAAACTVDGGIEAAKAGILNVLRQSGLEL